MSIAIAAFVISLFNLMWSIASQLNSWRLGKPQIRLNISTVHFKDRDPSLRVTVMNIGSSPVAITSIFILYKFLGLGMLRKRKIWRGFDYMSSDEGQISFIEGPPLQFKIDGYHSQNWVFDPEWLRVSLIEARGWRAREIEIRVGMATGKSVKQIIRIGEYFSSDEIAHLTSGP